mmetsp:Transcript_8807/g.15959  ORF Transcript_8807/g.15959 Transcript_8807/m.15959 type:complete len:351 (-) Transcript_8807:75-1127(-)
MLWVDKHRPSKLEELSFHDTTTKRLKSFAASSSLPHLLIYGPSGSGKKTRINALLREVFGPASQKLKLDKRTFTTPTKRTVDINMVSSNFHVELSPGDAGLNDRYVVQQVIREMASHKVIGTAADYKVVVLTEVDRLTRQAQAALRRTMEKYASTCRLILVCNSPSKVMDPVRSRCLGIRVAAPTHDEICQVLKTVANKESIVLPDELAVNIARNSGRNCRRAVLMLESCHVQRRDGLTADMLVPATDWELYIKQLAVDITREQTPQRLLAAREKLYELLVNCIPATIIIKTLVQEILGNLDDSLKKEVIEWAAFYEHRIAMGSKDIFHLEAFVGKYMAIYKRYLNDMFA